MKNVRKQRDKKIFVFKIKYDACDAIYVGEHGRTAKQRMREHQRAVESREEENTSMNTTGVPEATCPISKTYKFSSQKIRTSQKIYGTNVNYFMVIIIVKSIEGEENMNCSKVNKKLVLLI